HASSAALQWMIAAYTLTFAVMLIAGGRLGDVFGRRKMFVLGLVGFMAASLACACAQSAAMLIGSRVIQGGFAAMMIPQGLGMIRAVSPKDQVGKAFGLTGPVMGCSAMLGPVLGGLLVDDFGWRSVFLVNLPIGLLALTGAARCLPRDE